MLHMRSLFKLEAPILHFDFATQIWCFEILALARRWFDSQPPGVTVEAPKNCILKEHFGALNQSPLTVVVIGYHRSKTAAKITKGRGII
jgi:hypothetical protein